MVLNERGHAETLRFLREVATAVPKKLGGQVVCKLNHVSMTTNAPKTPDMTRPSCKRRVAPLSLTPPAPRKLYSAASTPLTNNPMFLGDLEAGKAVEPASVGRDKQVEGTRQVSACSVHVPVTLAPRGSAAEAAEAEAVQAVAEPRAKSRPNLPGSCTRGQRPTRTSYLATVGAS